MRSLNKAVILGNLGADPEIRSFSNGDKVANFTVATSESWKDKNTGERKERTEWHRVAVHVQGLVSVIENYVKKGSKVYLEGQLETRKWQDQSGQERYTTEIVLRPFTSTLLLLDGKDSGIGGQQELQSQQPSHYGNQAQAQAQAQQYNAQPAYTPTEDEIPF